MKFIDLAAGVFSSATVYLAFVFGKACFDISSWESADRGMCALFMLMAFVAGAGLSLISREA